MKKLSGLFFLIVSMAAIGQSKLSIIPLPKTMLQQKGNFALNNKVAVQYSDASLKPLAEFLITGISDAAAVNLATGNGQSQSQKTKAIQLKLDASVTTNDEGYVLDVTANNITIKARKENGLFYGIQTLLQLIPAEGKKNIPAVHIEDEPRFAWRGMMMDPCRHIWSVDFIKKFIDQLAYHKLNKFHWHLTEDQGWRIEIKKYPLLQTIAAYRNGTQVAYHRAR